ncbi:MAG: hypothetical protein ACQESR_08240 [Planctomycetota bacterium]
MISQQFRVAQQRDASLGLFTSASFKLCDHGGAGDEFRFHAARVPPSSTRGASNAFWQRIQRRYVACHRSWGGVVSM